MDRRPESAPSRATSRARWWTALARTLADMRVRWLALALVLFGCGLGAERKGEDVGNNQQPLSVDGAPTAPKKSSAKKVVWVLMKDQANLKMATAATKDWKGRGRAVHGALTSKASNAQTQIRSFLSQRGAKVRPFWIVNALRVEADQATIDAIAARSDVAQVLPDRVYSVPPVRKAAPSRAVNGVEWGIANIRAAEAWSAFGVKGEGIVVANIDTGVQFDHPALIAQYRGSQPGGAVDHNYNWFDPAHICGAGPCDNAGHGTHTMGTMVGDDGDPGDNQIGVAPHAEWIAAKGCEDTSCSLESLLAAAEWVLAPTDLSGQNPRPDLRPQIVNNSWGGPGGDPFYQAAVQSWVAAGIFPAFAAGNEGPSCDTAGSPGDYPESYAVAAYDELTQIADFSSRGGSPFGTSKPNIAAPGVSVRSSVPGDSYEYYSGTSMATPHLAGAVALLWSAAPALVGDVAATRAILDQTAIDTDDTSCGGSPSNNFVWGEGRLDAFAALDAAPRGPTGTLAGIVTRASNGDVLAGASIAALGSDGRVRMTTAGSDGAFALRLPVGTYDVTARLFGYVAASATVAVNEGATTSQGFALELAPSHAIRGTVHDATQTPIAGVRVVLVDTPLAPAVTDANGDYEFAVVPDGDYALKATAGGCFGEQSSTLHLDTDLVVDFALTTRTDAYGYSCAPTAFDYVDAGTVVLDSGDDDTKTVTLPFPFTYYGRTYTSAQVSVNGLLSFATGAGSPYNTPIPDVATPNAAIYGLWDDLYLSGGSILSTVVGSAPNRRFVVEWRDVSLYGDPSSLVSFEIVLHENGHIVLQYKTGAGDSATIGIEDERGADGLQYAYNQDVIAAGSAIAYQLPPSGFVQGVVTDANDGLPLAGATVRALSGDAQVRAAVTDAQGNYRLQVPVGSYVIEASKTRYAMRQSNVSVADLQVVALPFALQSPHASVSSPTLQLVMPSNQTRQRTLTLTNTGSLALEWALAESGGRRQTTVATAKLARNSKLAPNARNTRDLYATTVTTRSWRPDAAGDVIASFAAQGVTLPWGVGFDGDVWISDAMQLRNTELGTTGTPTGASWPATWASDFAADMAFDSARNLVCQVNVGGDNGIHCWDPATGDVTSSITGSLPWTATSQRGLAYREDDDSFYVGGWNDGTVYHVKGLSYADAGAVLGSCRPSDGNIAGLAWNGAAGVLWMSSNSDTDTLYELNPDDCTVLSTLAHPEPGYNGGGLDMDRDGNLWTVSQNGGRVYLLDSGVPAFADVAWLSEAPTTGTLAAGARQTIQVKIDTTGLAPGVYLAALYVKSNSGRDSQLRIPVSLVVTSYQQGVEAGGSDYTDTLGDPWSADRAYKAGSWGFVQKSSTTSTRKAIADTADPALYKTQRIDPYAYRFDNVPNGVYQIDLKFAELAGARLGKRLFDVIVENTLVLPAHDIRYDVGTFTADDHTFFVEVVDNRMDVRFVTRAGSDKPVVNALRITHRPDR